MAEARTGYNIKDVIEDAEFYPILIKELCDHYDPTGPSGKTRKAAIKFYIDNQEVFLQDMREFILQDLEGNIDYSSAYAFPKATVRGLVNSVVLPAVGTYIDIKTGRDPEIKFIPNTHGNKKYNLEKVDEYYKHRKEAIDALPD